MKFASRYWQFDLSPEDREKYSLILIKGLFEPTHISQGLCNAPDTFQKAMDILFRDLRITCVLVYLDDIAVFSQTFQDHLAHLWLVLLSLLGGDKAEAF